MSISPASLSSGGLSKPPPGWGGRKNTCHEADTNPLGSQGTTTKYERIRPIGRGSFGKVYLCKNQSTGENIVAKEINIRTKAEHDEALAEAQILSSVSHINIIAFKEVRRTGPQCLVIYMEFADDGDIDDKINRRKPRKLYFQSSVICQWLVQVCQAMDYLHSRGYIHRDIKTANMFLTKEGFVKLGDFGIAKSLDRNAQKVGQRTTATPVGTPMYIAPQICEGQPYTQKADIWSLGCCVYEMCCLRPAFHAKSMENLMSKIKNGNFQKEIPDHYSDELHDLVPMLLMKDPAMRPTIKDLLASSLMKPWLPTSPATLLAQGLTPTRYPPVVDPVELSSQSTPNFIKIEHSDDATRPRNRATPLVKQRPPPPSSHAEVQNSSVSVHSHYNAPIGASLTPQPMRRWPQRPSHHERETRGDREEAREMLQVPVLPHHRRNRPDGSAVVSSANTDGLPPDVSKFPEKNDVRVFANPMVRMVAMAAGVSLSVATPKHKHLSHSPRTSPLSSPRPSPPSSPRIPRHSNSHHHGNQGHPSVTSSGGGAAVPSSSPLVQSSVSAPMIVGQQQHRLGVGKPSPSIRNRTDHAGACERNVETGAGGSYASVYKSKLNGYDSGNHGVNSGDNGSDYPSGGGSSGGKKDPGYTGHTNSGSPDRMRRTHGRSNSDGGGRSHEYWSNPPAAKSKMRHTPREPQSLHTTPVGSPAVNRRLMQVPASNSLADLTKFYHKQRTHAHANGDGTAGRGTPTASSPLQENEGIGRRESQQNYPPGARKLSSNFTGMHSHLPHSPSVLSSPSPSRMQRDVSNKSRSPSTSDKSPSPLGSSR